MDQRRLMLLPRQRLRLRPRRRHHRHILLEWKPPKQQQKEDSPCRPSIKGNNLPLCYTSLVLRKAKPLCNLVTFLLRCRQRKGDSGENVVVEPQSCPLSRVKSPKECLLSSQCTPNRSGGGYADDIAEAESHNRVHGSHASSPPCQCHRCRRVLFFF